MKLKIIGKKVMKKNNLYNLRKKIFISSKQTIINNGWNENLFIKIAKNSKFSLNELNILFPDGYSSLLSFYIKEINYKIFRKVKKLNLSKLRTHEKVRKIILLKMKENQDEKKLIKKTFFTLILPKHSKMSLELLYEIVDEIWFLVGDKSTDFNFYSKRVILAAIYSSTLMHWINNNDLKKTEKFLDYQLKKVSKIPKIKNKFKKFSNFLPSKLKIIKNFENFMQ